MNKKRIMLIGIGPHSRNSHIPILSQLYSEIPFEFTVAIDIIEKKDEIHTWFASEKFCPKKLFFIDFFAHKMPSETEKLLDKIVNENSIDGVIIATPPYTHKSYALWALKNKLHILMDKPISTYFDVCNDENKAEAIYNDYIEILEAYKKIQKYKKTVFIINVKRRYHPGFIIVKKLINDISEKFNIPITSMIVYHSDGQWRFPHEIVSLNYHPFNVGYGVISHSGYHIIDAACWLYENTLLKGKIPDKVEVFSSFLLPNGFFNHLTRKDYVNIFGEKYLEISPWTDEFLKSITKSFGEIDAFVIIRFLKDQDVVSHIILNLQHNSFSRRSWLMPNKDLLKGNGRVKHEMFNIQQGPLQNIQIHSYHAYDRHTFEGSHFFTGGTQHFDIYKFSNFQITGEDKPFSLINAKEICEKEGINITLSQYSKIEVIKEFLNALTNKEFQSTKIESSLEFHSLSVKIMSAIYLSYVKQKYGEYPVVSFDFNN